MKKVKKLINILMVLAAVALSSGCSNSPAEQNSNDNQKTDETEKENQNESEEEVEKVSDSVDITKFKGYDTQTCTITIDGKWAWSDFYAGTFNAEKFNYLELDYEQATEDFIFGIVYSDDSRTTDFCFRYSNKIVLKLDASKKGDIRQYFFSSRTNAVTFKPLSIKYLETTDFFDPVTDSAASGDFDSSISAIEFAKDMKIGWDLGNSLECYTGEHNLSSELAWAEPYTTKEIVELGKNNGYTTIRIPITWGNHIIDENYTIDPQWMKRVKQVVDWAYDAGYYVIINEHGSDNDTLENPLTKASGFMVTYDEENVTESKAFLEAIWKQIASAFNNSYGERLIFETQNEPADCFHPDCVLGSACSDSYAEHHKWNPLEGDAADCWRCLKDFEVLNEYNQLILDTIRASGGNNANRFVMVCGMGSSVRSPLMSQFKMPEDSASDKLILTVHDYIMGAADKNAKTEYTQTEENELISRFSKLNNAYIQKGIPVVLGETGYVQKKDVNGNGTYEGISSEERIKWVTSISKITSSYGIPLIYWDVYSSGSHFGELDRENLCIRSGEEAFVSALFDNWDLSNEPLEIKVDTIKDIYEKSAAFAVSVMSESKTLNTWSDEGFICSVAADMLSELKENSIIKVSFLDDTQYSNFAFHNYKTFNKIDLSDSSYSETATYDEDSNFIFTGERSPLYIKLSADDAETLKQGFTIMGMNLTVTDISILY